MRVILIDDEHLALERLEILLKEIDGIQVAGKYSQPEQGLKAIMTDKPNVVFLDIEMAPISGIELAEIIQSFCSDIHIVFVTAYNEYAVKAFDLNAIDYVMKPIRRKRLNETINKLKSIKISHTRKGKIIYSNMICCTGALRFIRRGKEVEDVRVKWRTSKAKEIFAFLIHNRNKTVRKEVLLDLFWPQADPKKGYAQLYAAIYQIRKTLSSIDFHINITSDNEGYILDLKDVQLDIDEFEYRLKELFNKSDPELSVIQKILKLYSGDYMSEESYMWAENERERLRLLWLHYSQKASELLIQKEEYLSAIFIYQRMQALNPYIEISYFMLMKLYDLLGDRQSVEHQYHKLTKMLLEEYGEKPQLDILEWYQSWKEKGIKSISQN